MRKWNIDLDRVKNCGNYYKFTFFLLHVKKKRLWKGFRRNPIKPYIFIVSKHAWNTMRFIPWNMLILWNLFCALHKKEIFRCTISMETIFKRYAENVLILILLYRIHYWFLRKKILWHFSLILRIKFWRSKIFVE